MFVIFGWGRRTTKDYGPTLPMRCGNCNNNVYSRLIHVRTWFTLFFIPVIPYESKHYLLCDVCTRGFELHGADVERFKEMNRITSVYLSGGMSEDEYRRYVDGSRLLESSRY
ncbi:MAG: zinc ribbon domain-containing protein [Clostridia bacterium]|nr:zinc ribbon domain-containing protein [Clostridia bacterium]